MGLSVGLHGGLWDSMGVCGALWGSMGIYGAECGALMGSIGHYEGSVGLYGVYGALTASSRPGSAQPRTARGSPQGGRRRPAQPYSTATWGCPIAPHGAPQGPIEPHGTPQSPIAPHRAPPLHGSSDESPEEAAAFTRGGVCGAEGDPQRPIAPHTQPHRAPQIPMEPHRPP